MDLEEKIARLIGEDDHEYPYSMFPDGWHGLARKVIAAVREHDANEQTAPDETFSDGDLPTRRDYPR